MNKSRLILVCLAAACAVLGVTITSSGLSLGANSPPSGPALSQTEVQDLDTKARQDLLEVRSMVHFHARFPEAPPSGYYYTHVVFDRGHQEHGFAIWMQEPGSSDRGIHIIEAPNLPGSSKDTLTLPNLSPIALPNGTWMTLQKPDEPWRGLWIYAIVLNGVHIEVDGANRTLVESVAGSL